MQPIPGRTLQLAENRATPTFDNDGAVTYIGTATLIIQYGGFTILTDPNFLPKGDRVHLGGGLHSTRLTEPALGIDDLPPIDLCVLSHMHDDHFDHIAAERLPRELPIITTPAAARELRGYGFTQVFGLESWEYFTALRGDSQLQITSLPARHGPALLGPIMPQTVGSMLEFGARNAEPSFRLYVSGDTMVFDELNKIPERYPHIDAGIFHLGGTRILGVYVTMPAAEGRKAVELIKPLRAIAIHYNDYTVFKSPLEEFLVQVMENPIEGVRVSYLTHGETDMLLPERPGFQEFAA